MFHKSALLLPSILSNIRTLAAESESSTRERHVGVCTAHPELNERAEKISHSAAIRNTQRHGDKVPPVPDIGTGNSFLLYALSHRS
jgi:hypothetical protein